MLSGTASGADFRCSSLTDPTDPLVSLDILGWPPEDLVGVPEDFNEAPGVLEALPAGFWWIFKGLDEVSEVGFEDFAGGFGADFRAAPEDERFVVPGSIAGGLEPVDWLRTRFSLGSCLGLVLGLPRGFPSSGLGVVTLSTDASCDFLEALGASSGLLGLAELFLMPFKDFLVGLFSGTSSSSDSEDSVEDDDEGDDDSAGLDLRGVEVVEAVDLRAGAPGLDGYSVG